ncbi:MAG: CinA family protein [Alphaproteobacteria bacterium]
MDNDLITLASELNNTLSDKGLVISTAESCTGGLLSGAITEISGSSDVFKQGFITYSNEAKNQYLEVSNETLNEYGAVSSQVAEEMATGLIKVSGADIAIAITGVAGPGESENKQAGLVYIGIATKDKTTSHKNNFTGERADVRNASVNKALTIALETAKLLD